MTKYWLKSSNLQWISKNQGAEATGERTDGRLAGCKRLLFLMKGDQCYKSRSRKCNGGRTYQHSKANPGSTDVVEQTSSQLIELGKHLNALWPAQLCRRIEQDCTGQGLASGTAPPTGAALRHGRIRPGTIDTWARPAASCFVTLRVK